MEIEVFKHEQYGPTIISSGRDKATGKVVTIQHIGLPMTEDGIVSALLAKFSEPPYIEPPRDPKEPVMEKPKDMPAPVPIAKEVLDETAARVVELNKTPVAKRKFTFADVAAPIKEK